MIGLTILIQDMWCEAQILECGSSVLRVLLRKSHSILQLKNLGQEGSFRLVLGKLEPLPLDLLCARSLGPPFVQNLSH